MATRWERAWTLLRRLPWHRFGAGALAGAGWLLVTLFLRLYGLGVFLPEVAVDFVVGRIPGSIESFFIRTLGEGAKALALLTAVGVFLVLSGMYATAFRRVQHWLKRRWIVIAFVAFTAAGIVLLGILPLLGAGFFGSNTPMGAGFASFSQVLGFWVYAAILDYAFVDVAARHPEGFRLSRRQFLVGTASAVAFAVLAFYGLASLAVRKGRLLFASIEEMLAKEVTPTSEFYVVTKNVFDPDIVKGSWSLTVGGLVSNPATYDFAALEALSVPGAATASEEIVTLECVSNEVGGNLISTAKWNGVRLSGLLDAAGVDTMADWVVFTCADGYTAAVPMAKARDPATILAIRMNDEELTRAHGFPARIIVPGLYGMFHAKWITRLEAVRGEFLGFWQQKGWTNQGQVHTTAIIATPSDGSVVARTVPGTVPIGGVAYAGDRGISAVEVSTDGGATWNAARLYPRPSPLRWTLWRFDWSPARSGSFRIVARAVDGLGTPQDPRPAPPFPNGAAGYDAVTLLVA